MSGKPGRSGRRPIPEEARLREAIQAGAPPEVIQKCTEKLAERVLKTGDPKAYEALLKYRLPALAALAVDEAPATNETGLEIQRLRLLIGMGVSPNGPPLPKTEVEELKKEIAAREGRYLKTNWPRIKCWAR